MFCRDMRSTPLMAAQRSKHPRRAILFLFWMIAIPSAARCASLEESAKELARKIAASVPANEIVTCEIRNASSLQSDEVARIDAALKMELQDRGIPVAASGAANGASSGTVGDVAVTLSENVGNLVWSAEIHQGDVSRVVLLSVERPPESRAAAGAMPVTIHAGKFWEGPERILDAGDISNGGGNSWLVLLLPGGLRMEDRQSGAESMIDIASNQRANRDPWGNLGFGNMGDKIGFFLSPRVCTLDLQTQKLEGCLADGWFLRGAFRQQLPGNDRCCAIGRSAAWQRHRNYDGFGLWRHQPISCHRCARLHATGFVAGVRGQVIRRGGDQRRTGFPRADHGVARCFRGAKGRGSEPLHWKL